MEGGGLVEVVQVEVKGGEKETQDGRDGGDKLLVLQQLEE